MQGTLQRQSCETFRDVSQFIQIHPNSGSWTDIPQIPHRSSVPSRCVLLSPFATRVFRRADLHRFAICKGLVIMKLLWTLEPCPHSSCTALSTVHLTSFLQSTGRGVMIFAGDAIPLHWNNERRTGRRQRDCHGLSSVLKRAKGDQLGQQHPTTSAFTQAWPAAEPNLIDQITIRNWSIIDIIVFRTSARIQTEREREGEEVALSRYVSHRLRGLHYLMPPGWLECTPTSNCRALRKSMNMSNNCKKMRNCVENHAAQMIQNDHDPRRMKVPSYALLGLAANWPQCKDTDGRCSLEIRKHV
jgi:hypothetical protein